MAEGIPFQTGIERRKIRAAEWLYRWQLSSGIVGILFSILTFLGVATLVLGPLFLRMGLSYFETGLIALAFVVIVIIGFGVFLDRVVKFWSAQATVGTVRNQFLVDHLYQKELLALLYIQRPLLRSVRAILDVSPADEVHRRKLLEELDHSLEKVEAAIHDRRWPIEPHERVY